MNNTLLEIVKEKIYEFKTKNGLGPDCSIEILLTESEMDRLQLDIKNHLKELGRWIFFGDNVDPSVDTHVYTSIRSPFGHLYVTHDPLAKEGELMMKAVEDKTEMNEQNPL